MVETSFSGISFTLVYYSSSIVSCVHYKAYAHFLAIKIKRPHIVILSVYQNSFKSMGLENENTQTTRLRVGLGPAKL